MSIVIPDTDQSTAIGRDIADLRAAIEAARQRIVAGRRDYEAARNSRGAAEAADAKAYAAAQREGRKDPGPKEVKALALAEEDARRRVLGEEYVVKDYEREMERMRQDMKVAWLVDLMKKRDPLQAQAREALIAAADALQAIHDIDGLGMWAATGKSIRGDWPATSLRRGEQKRPVELAPAVTAALEALDGWQPRWAVELQAPAVKAVEEDEEVEVMA